MRQTRARREAGRAGCGREYDLLSRREIIKSLLFVAALTLFVMAGAWLIDVVMPPPEGLRGLYV